MTPSEEFQSKLETGNVAEVLNFLVSKMLEFKVTTWIAADDRDLENSTDTITSHSQVAPNFCLKTTFNLLEGIEHQLGKSILTSEAYLNAREYHLSQVDRLDETVKNNLEILKKIVEMLDKNHGVRDIEASKEKITIVDRESTSISDAKTDLNDDNRNDFNRIVSRTSQNSVLFLADDTIVTNGDFKQHEKYDNIEIDSQVRTELKQEDWGDWLDVSDEPQEKEINPLFESKNRSERYNQSATLFNNNENLSDSIL
jgi:hypothetical protein